MTQGSGLNEMTQILIEQIVENIGCKIKMLRTEAGYSLQQLSERAGVSGAAIHKIEKGQMTPTITLLMKIAEALGKRVGYLIGEEEPDDFDFVQGVEFIPREKRKCISNADRTIELEHLALRLKDARLHAGVYRLKPGMKSGDKPHSHVGEELIFQVEGSVEYMIEGRSYPLNPQDSLHFLSELPHAWRVLGDTDCVNIVILTPPPYGATELAWTKRS